MLLSGWARQAPADGSKLQFKERNATRHSVLFLPRSCDGLKTAQKKSPEHGSGDKFSDAVRF
jgi:hypothetical protein